MSRLRWHRFGSQWEGGQGFRANQSPGCAASVGPVERVRHGVLGWIRVRHGLLVQIEDGSGPAAGVGISSAPGGWARVVYTTQGEMLQG